MEPNDHKRLDVDSDTFTIPGSYEPLDVTSFTVEINFRFGCNYEWDIQHQAYQCMAVYRTDKDFFSIGPRFHKDEQMAKFECRRMIQEIWRNCVQHS